jgi:uncharacterized protein
MTRQAEVRYLTIEAAEVRVDRADGKTIMRGIAIPYGKLSVDLGGFRERFRAGCLADLGSMDVRALVNHNRDLILGRNRAGTLRLMDGPDALRYEIDVPDTSLASHYVSAVERGDMTGASFRFYALTDAWGLEGGETIRDIVAAEIDDVSIVAYPAYPDTTAAVRSLERHRESDRAAAVSPSRDGWLDGAMARLRLAEAEAD